MLRPFEDSDLDAYAEIVMSVEVRRALHARRLCPLRCLAGDGTLARPVGAQGTGHWAVVEIETGLLVGRAGLNLPESPGWPGIEIGWTFHPRHWGRGFSTEAGARSIVYSFDDIGADQVCSLILPENGRSAAVATRLGFTRAESLVLSHFTAMPHDVWRLTGGNGSHALPADL